MSEAPTHATPTKYPQITINPLVLHRSRLPFTISLASFVALLLLIFAPALIGLLTGRPVNHAFRLRQRDHADDPAGRRCICRTRLLFVTTVASGYVGYKLVVASGASPENPIPPSNYSLLAPLIQEGKIGIDRSICPALQPERLHRNLHQAGTDRTAADHRRAHADLRGAGLAADRPGKPEELLRPDQADARRLHRIVRAAAGRAAPHAGAEGRRGAGAVHSHRSSTALAGLPRQCLLHRDIGGSRRALALGRNDKKDRGGSNNEDAQLSGLPVRRAAAGERAGSPEAAGHAGAAENARGRRVPFRPAHLGRLLRDRRRQEADAGRPRHQAAAHHGARERRRGGGVRARTPRA